MRDYDYETPAYRGLGTHGKIGSVCATRAWGNQAHDIRSGELLWDDWLISLGVANYYDHPQIEIVHVNLGEPHYLNFHDAATPTAPKAIEFWRHLIHNTKHDVELVKQHIINAVFPRLVADRQAYLNYITHLADGYRQLGREQLQRELAKLMGLNSR